MPELKRTTAKIGEFTDKAGKLLPDISKTLDTFQKIGEFAEKTEKLLPDISKTFQNINKEALPELVKIAAKLGDFTDKTEKLLPEITKTFQSINKDVIPDFLKTNDELQITIRNWGKVGERTDNLLQANEDKLVKTIDRMQETLKRVAEIFNDENQKSIHDILKNVRTSSDRFDSMARGADDFIKDGRGTLKRFNESLAKIEDVLGDVQKATRPLADRSESIVKNIDESTDKLNRTLTDVRELLQMLARGDGTIQKLLSDPALYNNLNEVSCGLSRILPRVDRIMRDVEIFSDKIARHPDALFLRDLFHPASGLKESPTPYKIIPLYP